MVYFSFCTQLCLECRNISSVEEHVMLSLVFIIVFVYPTPVSPDMGCST